MPSSPSAHLDARPVFPTGGFDRLRILGFAALGLRGPRDRDLQARTRADSPGARSVDRHRQQHGERLRAPRGGGGLHLAAVGGGWTTARWRRRCSPRCRRRGSPGREPDWADVHRELRRHKGVTLQLRWLEYREIHPNGHQCSRFCDRYRTWRGRLDMVIRALPAPPQPHVTVRLGSEASIEARASRSAGFTDRLYFCLTATTWAANQPVLREGLQPPASESDFC